MLNVVWIGLHFKAMTFAMLFQALFCDGLPLWMCVSL